MSEAISQKYAADIEKARALGNKYDCDVWGRFPWDRSERRGRGVSLSKASLGEFAYVVLSHGGDITNYFVMWPKVKRSAVFIRVKLTITAKEAIEAETAFRFDPPPVPRFT
jgi:hypothetical protein